MHASRSRSLLATTFVALFLCTLSACKPSYPRCASDAQCQGHGEICVNGQCQECRDAGQCLLKYPHEVRQCVEGRCELHPECHVSADCQSQGADLVCRNNRCVPECAHDGDCTAGQSCISHKCVSACTTDSACPAGFLCADGHCISEAEAQGLHSCRPTRPGDVVSLETVNFAFNQFDLSAQTREVLEQAAHCLKQAPASLRVAIEGHCDDRGTQEYNLALGERRAQAVLKYLQTLGVDGARLEPVSKGENEPVCTEANEACYARNRRVDFVQRAGSSN